MHTGHYQGPPVLSATGGGMHTGHYQGPPVLSATGGGMHTGHYQGPPVLSATGGGMHTGHYQGPPVLSATGGGMHTGHYQGPPVISATGGGMHTGHYQVPPPPPPLTKTKNGWYITSKKREYCLNSHMINLDISICIMLADNKFTASCSNTSSASLVLLEILSDCLRKQLCAIN